MTFEEAVQLYTDNNVIVLYHRNRKEILSKILSEPFDPNLHYPLAYMHIHYIVLDIARTILDHATDKNDETYKQLDDYLNALSECQHSDIGIFPLTVAYRNWWDGPHLSFQETLNGATLTKWFPIRVNFIEKDSVDVFIAFKEEDITYGQFTLPLDRFPPSIKDDAMGEIAFYSEEYLIKLHAEGVWEQPPELKAVRDKAMPPMIKSHEVLQNWAENEYSKK